MPVSFLYLGLMLVIICLWFLLVKRPIYEGILISFFALVTITWTWTDLWMFFKEAISTSLLFSMIAFVAMTQVLSKTKIIDNCVLLILSILGRIPGGAGFASIAASSFMGALSGSGPGNVMTTGTITIPAMKKSGFPAELAANVESTASYLGNMIPPSANIVAAIGAYCAVYGDDAITTGSFWMVCWGISLWFILSRFIQLAIFCIVYKIKPMKKEDIPPFGKTLKQSWTGLLLPVVILVPFILDFILNAGFITDRLGKAGAKHFSSSLLIFIAGLAALIGILASKKFKLLNPWELIKTFSGGAKGLVPTVATCIFGYMIGELFAHIGAANEMGEFINKFNLSYVALAFILPLLTCFIGMVIPGSSIVVMLGPVIITLLAEAGVNPLLAAAMLPCMCGVMSGITPPFALGMYAGMSIAESDLGKTIKNGLWWVAVQYLLEVVVLLGWLPILGL